MPRINGVLESTNVAGNIVMVAGRRIDRNYLVNRNKAPLCYVEIANEFKPGLKTLFPAAELGIATALIVARILGHAAHIAELKRHSGHTGGTKGTFMHKEIQGIS